MTSNPNNRKYCSVYGCLNRSTTNPEMSFFTLPKDDDRRMRWLQLIGREDLINKRPLHYYVCEVHFNEQDVCMRSVRKILKKNCSPNVNLPYQIKDDKHTQTDVETSDGSTQTVRKVLANTITEIIDFTPPSSSRQPVMSTTSDTVQIKTAASTSANTPRKRKLESKLLDTVKRLKVQKSRKSSQEMLHKLCDCLLTKDLAELVKAQTMFCTLTSSAYKMFCLNLYYISPQAYRLLQNTLSLPSRRTLNKLHIPMTTEVNDELMAAFEMKVKNMSEREKQCSLVIDSTNLKTNLFYDIKNDKIIGFHEVQGVQSPSPAKYALVVLVKGIFVEWHQPIGFSLLSECSNDPNISLWIDKIISKLFEIGLKIRVFVSNLGSDLLKASKKRGVSVNKTYFSVDNHKIYYIFDAPHLIKSIRNNLMTYDFHFQNHVAKYEHIVQFYEHDKKKDYKQAHKLTIRHVKPTNYDKIKVHYATQLLSRSVASGLSTFIDFKVIDESARATVEFIHAMNDLFDTLNSSKIRESYLYKNAFTGTEHQKDFLNQMLTFFQTLKLRDPKNGKDVTKTVKFINGFVITIQSILQLHEDLKQEGYPYLLTRRLNQDIIGNLFGKIRSKNGTSTNPTSRQFISAFRKIVFANLTRAPKEGNCAKDLTEFLVHLRDHNIYENKFNETDNVPTLLAGKNNDHTPESTLHEIVRSDYVQLVKPENCSFVYVCGALLKKCLERHNNCELLTSYLNASIDYSAKDLKLNSLVVPPDDFVKNIELMEQVFRKSFEGKHINRKIGMSIYEQLKDVEFSLPCPCFPKTFLQKLFVRMRIYLALTSNNKAFRTCQKRRKLFLL